MKITLGTRGAKIALVQAKAVADLLTAAGAEVEIKPFHTIGDSLNIGLAGQRDSNIFTKEIDEALAKGQVNVAVHDMTHLSSTLPAGISFAAVPQRLDPREVFISNKAKKLGALAKGSRVGAAGTTRAPQLKQMNRDFEFVPIISDIEANLKAVSEDAVDAVVMAAADLVRLGIERAITEPLPPDKFIPAIGQGALAVEVGSLDRELVKFVSSACHHNATGIVIRAERAFLKSIKPDGSLFAAHAEIRPGGLAIFGFISDSEGEKFFADKESGTIEQATELGKTLAEKLLKKFT